jgi:hypothetical protein
VAHLGRREHRGKGLLVVFLLLVVTGGGVAAWLGLRQGPLPTVAISSDRPAVGPATRVTARFAEPQRGLGHVRIELQQGERVEVLGDRTFPRAGAFGGARTGDTVLEAQVGTLHQAWLQEGEVVVRAVADRNAGYLRSPAPIVVETRLPVRLHPPHLGVLSKQHYVRQGGAGAVVAQVDPAAVRSGVRAGTREFRSFPLPDGGAGHVFVIYGVPWDGVTAADIRVFAEDAAGNRAEQTFVDLFKPVARRPGLIEIDDAFLQRVVPPIIGQTPGLDASGTLLDQYLRVNGALRRTILTQIGELCAKSEARFLWEGPFLQMPNSARMAGFAETRTYRYQGRAVDTQTHLGLDLASTSRAEVPAANRGRVAYSGWLGLYGNAVLLDHGFGVSTLYGHLSEITVKAGELVEKGQSVGRSGTTGLAGGDHLHLEVFVQGLSVDPAEWLDAHWIQDNLASKLPLPPPTR